MSSKQLAKQRQYEQLEKGEKLGETYAPLGAGPLIGRINLLGLIGRILFCSCEKYRPLL